MDIAGINAYVLYSEYPECKMRRADFLMHLARELVLPALKQQVYNEKLPRELRMTLWRVLEQDLPPPQPPSDTGASSTRKLCRICPSKLKRQTRFVAFAQNRSVCSALLKFALVVRLNFDDCIVTKVL